MHTDPYSEPRGEGGHSAMPFVSPLETAALNIPEKLVHLPPLNPTALRLLSLSAESDADLRRFVRLVEADPSFGAAVLQLANSPLFGFASSVYALSHAIALIGIEHLKALAVTAALKTYVGSGNSPEMRRCWRHSLACALLSQELAPFFNFSDSRAYAVGLMHDIGRLGLIKSYAVDYAQLLQQEYVQPEEVLRVEGTVLGLDHCKAGFWLTKTWGFPGAFSKVSGHHHDPESPELPDLVRLVRLSCKLADCLGFGAFQCQNSPGFEELRGSVPSLPSGQAKWSVEELQQRIADKVQAAER